MASKSNMSAHKGCRIEHSFGWNVAYLVRCFNETENTNENTNLRELADVKEALPSGTSQQKRCQCHSNHC